MDETKKFRRFTRNVTDNVRNTVKSVLTTDKIFHESEVYANKLVASVMLLSIILLMATVVLNEVGIYTLDRDFLNRTSAFGILALFIPWILCVRFQYDRDWLKYLCLLAITVVYASIDSMLTYRVALIMAVPVLLSSRYYSRRLTIFIAILSVIVFGISASVGYYFGIPDLNYLNVPSGTSLTISNDLLSAVRELDLNTRTGELVFLLRSYSPRLFSYSIIAMIAVQVSSRGRDMVQDQDKISSEHSRVETELGVARAIQERALPIVHTLKAHPEFDLAATMNPAKEIGGDFYDFFFVDPTHLALMIADVSGKGVPAALFMMVSKIYLDNAIVGNNSPGQILAEVNHHICEKDLEDMFVTVWLGLLDLETGKLTSASAGHEYPIIGRKDSQFEIIKDKHGLVLGGMDGVRYRETEIQLYPGDTLFVYTDGVTDTTNSADERFGLDRTVACLNESNASSMSDLIDFVKQRLAEFSGEEPQFDDTTMMAIKLCSYKSLEGISVRPDTASIEHVETYLEEELIKANLDQKLIRKVNICIDEIYTNIVKYSGATWAEASAKVTDDQITVTFKDNGIPFNPLHTKEPDTTLDVEDRIPGGLGILLTKKLMDRTSYQYLDGRNVFYMNKNIMK